MKRRKVRRGFIRLVPVWSIDQQLSGDNYPPKDFFLGHQKSINYSLNKNVMKLSRSELIKNVLIRASPRRSCEALNDSSLTVAVQLSSFQRERVIRKT